MSCMMAQALLTGEKSEYLTIRLMPLSQYSDCHVIHINVLANVDLSIHLNRKQMDMLVHAIQAYEQELDLAQKRAA